MQENMAADSKGSTTVYNIEAKNSNVIIGDGAVLKICPTKGNIDISSVTTGYTNLLI